MAKPTIGKQIRDKAIEIIKSEPRGIRYAQLGRRIRELLPHIGETTVWPAIGKLDAEFPSEVYKPERGLFIHASFREAPEAEKPLVPVVEKIKEEKF